MRVRTVRPHRNDHENDQGKPGWKHTGTEYEHPEPEGDIKRGLIEPIGEVPAAEEPAKKAETEPNSKPKPAAKRKPAKTPAKTQTKAAS